VNVIWLMAHTTVVGKDALERPAVSRPARRAQPRTAPQVNPAAAPISRSRSLPVPVAV
jgi:hypothetical protein